MNIKKPLLLVPIVFLILTTLSCNRGVKDYSIGNDEYTKLGMPDHTKNWNTDDYGDANITLSTLLNEAPLSLPGRFSDKSGKVFNRLVSEENLSFVYDTAIPLKIRAYMIMYYPRLTGEFENFYSYQEKGRFFYSDELIGIYGFNLSIQNKMLELSAIIDTSRDESLSDFKDGKLTVRYYYLEFISSLPAKISRPGFKSARGVDELIKAVCESVNTNMIWMTAPDKAKMIVVMESLTGITRSRSLKKDLTKTADSLSG